MTAGSLAIPVDTSATMASLSLPKKLLLLLANAFPLFQVITLAGLVWALHRQPWICLAAALGFLYLLPPLLCRLLAVLMPIRRVSIPIGSRDFFAWWIALNLQAIFCRFPALEEALRLLPGCYSLWLRLWGSRIGRLTYWAPGVQILDRQYLHLGDHVTFGAAVRLNPHVIVPDAAGRMVLHLAPITIGQRVSVGGYSLLVAGVDIAPDQCTRAFTILPPFSRLEGGHRHKGPLSPSDAVSTEPA